MNSEEVSKFGLKGLKSNSFYAIITLKGGDIMKRKTIILVLAGIFALIFIGSSIFFALQGVSAANKRQEYLDVYKLQAEEYIKSSTEITGKYGEDIPVKFDNSVTYSENKEKGLFDRYIEVFHPQVPDTLEKFSEGIDMIKFKVKINGDTYEITFEKNDQGKLFVSNLMAVEN